MSCRQKLATYQHQVLDTKDTTSRISTKHHIEHPISAKINPILTPICAANINQRGNLVPASNATPIVTITGRAIRPIKASENQAATPTNAGPHCYQLITAFKSHPRTVFGVFARTNVSIDRINDASKPTPAPSVVRFQQFFDAYLA